MAAVTTALMGLVRAGDHVVAAKALFGSCRWVVEEWLPRFGVTSTLVNGTDLDAWKKAAQKNTKAFFLETPTNPTLEVIDIAAVADIAHNAAPGLSSTMSSPHRSTRARSRSAQTAWSHSATKHIDGQGRILGGIILGSEKLIMDHYHQISAADRAFAVGFQCLILRRALETLPVRVERQTANAGTVAGALAGHKKLTRMIYPGRSDHPQADIIKKQMRAGSTLCSFEVKGGKEGAFRFLNALQLIGITNNLGDAKSLVTHPTTTTHQRLTPEQRAELGIGDGLIRFSAGLEHADDLTEDLLTALDKV